MLMRNQFATHTDYKDLLGLIPSNTKFLPSNVDGIAERNGKFLVMEWKRPNERISKGQEFLLKALAKTPNFVVIIIIGDTDNGMNIERFYYLQPIGKNVLIGTSTQEFKDYYTFWYEWANNGK
jgi:hypothetical protein